MQEFEEFEDIRKDPEFPEFLARFQAWERKAMTRVQIQWPELEEPDHIDFIMQEELPEPEEQELEPETEIPACFQIIICKAISQQAQNYLDERRVNYRNVQDNIWFILLACDPEGKDVMHFGKVVQVFSTGVVFRVDAQGCARTIIEVE